MNYFSMDYFNNNPSIKREINGLSQETLNSPMMIDIKNDPRLEEYQYYLNESPGLIPGAINLYHSYIRPLDDEEASNFDIENPISNEFDKSSIINLIINEIKSQIESINESPLKDSLKYDEIDDENNIGIQMRIKPSIAIAVPEPTDINLFEEREGRQPFDLDLINVDSTLIPDKKEQMNANFEIATPISRGGKTKKRINKYKKGKSKTNKTHNKKSKKYKNNKKNRKTMRKKTK